MHIAALLCRLIGTCCFRCIASIISYHIKRMAGFGSVMDLLVRIPGDRFSQVETHLLFIYVIYVVLLLLLIEYYICMF